MEVTGGEKYNKNNYKGETSMKHRLFIIASLSTVVCIVLIGVLSTFSAQAKHWEYSNADLSGTYAFQLSGVYVFPSTSPLSVMNGPFAVNGIIRADGQGNMMKNFIVNYNGQTYRIEDAESTYEVDHDGTYTETFVAQFGQAPVTITYSGVLIDGGREVRLMVTGFSLPGITLPTDYIGMVISGSMIRQEGYNGFK